MAQVRELTGSDPAVIERITAIHAACFDKAWKPADFQRFCKDDAHRVFVLEGDKNVLIGFAVFSMVLDEAEILTIAIDPPRQGQGAAQVLLTHSIRNIQKSGVLRVFLEVGENNNAALSLYGKVGFTKTGVRKSYYTAVNGEKLDAYTMALESIREVLD